MNFNFKKIASAASSALMVGSTVALAAAANYPAPFVSGSSADVAIVVGDNASADLTAAALLSADLSTTFVANGGGSSGSTTTTTTGEVFPLFTSSTELWMNTSINAARTTITDDDLPTVLAEGDFGGDDDAEITQTIVLNGANRVLFGQEPTSDDDATIYLDMGTTAGTSLYNSSVVFDNVVNFTDSGNQGETMDLFGREWTVGADTTTTELVLYKSSEKVLLTLGGTSPTPSRSVDVDGESYTIELVSGSDTDATVRVTNSAGESQSREVDEDESKKINGVEITVASVDESEALGQVTAEVTVASDKVLLVNGQEVRYGTEEETIEGTTVNFVTTAYTGNISQIVIQVFAEDDDVDALIEGGSFLDPVYGSFKFDFTGVNIPMDDEERDSINLDYSGDDELDIEFTNHEGETKKFQWYDNSSTARLAYGTDSKELINVHEYALVNMSEYFVVGNQDEAYLLKFSSMTNGSDGYNSDAVVFQDVFTGSNMDVTITGEGAGTIVIGGKTYSVAYGDASSSTAKFVRVNYPDSSSTNMVLYPAIETEKGAKVSLYEPLTINISANAPVHGQTSAIAGFMFPDGDDYATTLTVAYHAGGGGAVALTGLTTATLNGTANVAPSTDLTVGALTYNVTYTNNSGGQLIFRLETPDTGSVITTPAVVVWEEEEDTNDVEHALVVIPEGGGIDSDGVGISTVRSSAGMNGAATYTELESNDDLSQLMTLYGTVVQLDQSESDQTKAEIWYPDDQVQAMIYVAEGEASTSTDGSSGVLGDIVVDASEVSTVSNKNLIVLGGSCINTVAAQLLGSDAPLCGAAFTAATQVGSGSFLIQSFESPFNANKVALLVAGYEAEDTTNAANALKSTDNAVDTTVGKKYTGTTATSLTPVL